MSRSHAPVWPALAALFLLAAAAPARARQDPPARGGADPSQDAFRLGSPAALPTGLSEEVVWPAATAEQWRKPCLVRWQRSFDDAVAVARARHMPLMVAVNMDGEIASEHFAGVRYREPETAEKLARYLCVIASVYRHTPRDHDPSGARVECPRFGTVTCGEHVEAERQLYERYFDGLRVAPRHIVLDLEGRETFDVYFAWDTQTVLTGFVRGAEGWPEPLGSPEPTLENLARSRDVADRELLERQWREGERATRVTILRALAGPAAADHVDLLRAAISGFDPEYARLARVALAQCETDPALDRMAEALAVPLEESERAQLLDAVRRLAGTLPRARTLAALHDGLRLEARALSLEPPEDRAAAYEASAQALESLPERPRGPDELLDLAEALLVRAEDADARYVELFLQDARRYADEAERLGARGPRLDALVAAAASGLGERGLARERALAAVEAGLLDAEPGALELAPAVRARVLGLFGAARQAHIRAAFRAGESWDPAWLADAIAAYAALARAPGVAEPTLLEHHDFLRWIGATIQAGAVLERALELFPDSASVHERLRERLLWEGGPELLERGYAERLQARGTEPGALDWFAGYASFVAAEHLRRRGRFEPALEAYARSIAHYRARAGRLPEAADDADHYVALALAGRARVDMERGELAAAADALCAALALRPQSAGSQDGLGLTPLATARMLQARLTESGLGEGAARVQAAIDTLDAALLAPPQSEVPRAARGR
jgi:hypothetical protein